MEQKKLLCLVVWRAVAWARAAFENRKKMAIARQTHATACSSCSPSAVRTWVVRGPRRLCHYFLFVCLWLLGFLTNKKLIGTISENTRRSSTAHGAERTAGVAAPNASCVACPLAAWGGKASTARRRRGRGRNLGRKTRSAFFTPILASALFTRSLRVFLRNFAPFFTYPLRAFFYSDPPPRFLPRF